MSDQGEELKRLKLESARERYQAIEAALKHFQGRIESSPATRKVIHLILRAITKIEKFIEDETANEDLLLLTDDELESRIHRVTRIIPAIHWLVSIVERSDVTAVPAEIAAPLRREIDTLYSAKAELIVTSSTDLNYSIQSLPIIKIKKLFNLDDEDLKEFPERLFIASLPSIEYDQALQHCIFGHELSHPLWDEHSIQNRLPPLIVDKKKLTKLVEKFQKQAAGPTKDFPLEAFAEAIRAPQRVQSATVKWCEELTSDLFALAFLGPAFIFSVIYFTCSFERLDFASDTHPPSRLRLNLLFRFLDILYTEKTMFSQETAEFLMKWRHIGDAAIVVEDEVHEIVLDTIANSKLYAGLPSIVHDLLSNLPSYTQDNYKNDIKVLCPLIDAQIPPAEYLSEGKYKPATFAGILNAGWECYLRGLTEYQARLPPGRKATTYDLKRSYNSFLLKSLELNETIRSWNEVQL
jgi:hypothetical protein